MEIVLESEGRLEFEKRWSVAVGNYLTVWIMRPFRDKKGLVLDSLGLIGYINADKRLYYLDHRHEVFPFW